MAHDALTRFKKLQAQIEAFFQEKGFERDDPIRQSLPWRCAHFWLLVGKSFVRNRCPVRASALAYSSLLALIPMLAVVLSISTGILKSQGEEPIRLFINKLVDQIAPYTEADPKPAEANAASAQSIAAQNREKAVQAINGFIKNTQSGAIGVVSMILLVFVAIVMLMRIEGTFNDIWGITRSRSWYTQIVLYWATISLGPLLLIVAIGLTSGSHFEATRNWVTNIPWIGGLASQILPVIVLVVMFTMLYQLMPATRVQPAAAVVGGLVAGGLWHLNNILGVHFVSRVTSNNAIYGSLGMVPVFMIGLYFGWLILLFGGQVSYAFQNRQIYLQEKQAESVNQRGREFIALRVMTEVARRFAQNQPAPSLTALADALAVPSRLVGQSVQVLILAGLLHEVADRAAGYAPSRPIDRITVHDVLQALRVGQGQELATREDEYQARLRAEFGRIGAAEQSVAGALTLQDLAASPKTSAQEAS